MPSRTFAPTRGPLNRHSAYATTCEPRWPCAPLRGVGRPKSHSETEEARIRERLVQGESVRALATELGTSRMTVMRIRDAVMG
jgi:transposase